MHSSLVRLQNVFGFFTTVAFAVAAVVAATVVLSPQNPSAQIEVRNIQVVKGRSHYYSKTKQDFAHIKFDLDADFTSLFNWNTKQLYVYVLATYPGASISSPPSQSIIWDTIIASPAQTEPFDPIEFLFADQASHLEKLSKKKVAEARAVEVPVKAGNLTLKNVKPKYQIADPSGVLAEKQNVTLEVGWNVQPWVGALTWTLPEGREWGRWSGLKGGRSQSFNLPALKGKNSDSNPAKEVPQPGKALPVVGKT